MDSHTKTMFACFVNDCMENIHTALSICAKNEYDPTPSALAYMSQAYTCAKNLQLLTGLYENDAVDKFVQCFNIFNSDFLENVSIKHSLQSTFIDVDRLEELYRKAKQSL